MEQIRKPIGLLVLIFMGMPALFGVTWFAGITRAVSNPDFLPNLPVEISERLPETVDLFMDAARHPGAVEDDEARTWLLAAAEAETTPGELLEEIGLLEWLRTDLYYWMRGGHEFLRGGYSPRTLELDLKPLKRALEHEAIDRWFLEVVENLPPCTPRQEKVWKSIAEGRRYYGGGLPACRPDGGDLKRIIERMRRGRRTDLPDEVELCLGDDFQFLGLDVLSLALIISLALYVVPAFFIASGAFIAVPLGYRTFKWTGVPILLTGLAVLITAVLPKLILKGTTGLIAWIGTRQSEPCMLPSYLIEDITERIYDLFVVVTGPLFSPVIMTGLIVSIVGGALYAISLIADRGAHDSYESMIPHNNDAGKLT